MVSQTVAKLRDSWIKSGASARPPQVGASARPPAFVAATLLQSDSIFREATHKKIKELGGDDDFGFFDAASLQASQFEVIYVIVAPWRGRSLAEALPFFSKVNLLRTAEELINRGFKVSLSRIDTNQGSGGSAHS